MTMDREPLSISRMRRHLDTEVIGYHVYLFGTVAAAQAAARRLAARGAEEGTVVLAEDAVTGALHASVLLRPTVAPREVPLFAPIVPLAVVEAIEADGVAAEIRWPNDVVVDGRTLATALAECDSVDDRVAHLIVAVDLDLDAAGPAVNVNAFVA